jgi:hypothetical protein
MAEKWSQKIKLTIAFWSQKAVYGGEMVTKKNLLRRFGHKKQFMAEKWSQKIKLTTAFWSQKAVYGGGMVTKNKTYYGIMIIKSSLWRRNGHKK